jgi:4-amino-4-deoxy-L-arabinose transferase-like glycosyltransferase
LPGEELSIDIKNPILLVSLIAIAFFTGLSFSVTLNSPIAFGDEAYYVHIGRWIAQNFEYPINVPLYETTLAYFDFPRPPAWDFLQSGFYMLFGFSELIVKFLTPFIAFLTGVSVYILVKKMLNEKIGLVTALALITIPAYVTYTVLFYVEMLLVFYISLSFLLAALSYQTGEKKYWVASGIFAALSILTKTAGYFALAFYAFFFLLYLYKKRFDEIKRIFPLLAIIVLLLVTPFYLRNQAYYGSTQIPFIPGNSKPTTIQYTPQNQFAGRATETQTEAALISFGIGNYVNFAFGILWFVPLGFAIGLFLLWIERESKFIFVVPLLLMLIPLTYFSLNIRVEDTARYVLGLSLGIAFTVGIFGGKLWKVLEDRNKYIACVFVLLIIFAAYWNLNSKLTAARFYNTQTKSYAGYKQFSPAFFDMCNYIKSNLPKDAILLSLHTHPTVYNCERQAFWNLPDLADIIATNSTSLMKERLKANGITHIFVQKFSLSNEPVFLSYPVSFVETLVNDTKDFKQVRENGASLDFCKSALAQGSVCDGTILFEVLG